MSDKTPILTSAAPAPAGPYSQGLAAAGLLFCSGQVGVDATTRKMVEGGVEEQARQVMANLAAVLAAAGCTFGDVVKTTIFLTNIDDFKAVNAVYGESFEGVLPARSTVAVAALPGGAKVEIEAVAVRR